MKADTLNWPIALVLLMSLIIYTFIAFKIYAYQPKKPFDSNIDPKFSGIKGWLLIVAIGVFLAPLVQMYQMAEIVKLILFHNTWNIIISPEENSFNPYLSPLILFEVIMSQAILIGRILVIILLVRYKRLFVNGYIGLNLVNFIYIVLDHTISYFALSSPLNLNEMREAILIAIDLIIVGTYLMNSKRIKATFIR